MRERVFQFGPNRSLVGIVCDAGSERVDHSDTAIVFVNSGLLHRVGPSRIYVKAARGLSSGGFVTMRFDLSGVGDSEPRADSLPFEERSVVEIRQAIDLLEGATGARKFILTGICSGADNAVDVAAVDPRVAGIVPIDFYSLPSAGSRFHAYKRRFFSARSWIKLLSGRSDLWANVKRTLAEIPFLRREDASLARLSPRDEYLKKFRLLAGRGTHVCLIFSAGSPAYYNHKVLFESALRSIDFQGEFSTVHFDSADHGFTTRYHQRQLIDEIEECVRGFVASDLSSQVS